MNTGKKTVEEPVRCPVCGRELESDEVVKCCNCKETVCEQCAVDPDDSHPLCEPCSEKLELYSHNDGKSHD